MNERESILATLEILADRDLTDRLLTLSKTFFAAFKYVFSLSRRSVAVTFLTAMEVRTNEISLMYDTRTQVYVSRWCSVKGQVDRGGAWEVRQGLF